MQGRSNLLDTTHKVQLDKNITRCDQTRPHLTSMVSCQKGPTRHADAWRIRPFWQDTLDMSTDGQVQASSCDQAWG